MREERPILPYQAPRAREKLGLPDSKLGLAACIVCGLTVVATVGRVASFLIHLDAFAELLGMLAVLGTLACVVAGIPLAIAAPGLRVTLVEANGKKARFLREAVRTLGLANAEVAQARIEALDQPGAFDAITARALATLPQILELGGRLVGPGGKLLALKGTRPGEEIAALPPGWRLEALHRLRVPGLEGERHLAVVGREPTRTA